MEVYKNQAMQVLQRNDRGGYTVPTHGLYPFQWNWDSCLSALGFMHFNEARAWAEIETLFTHQWPDGMVPHIVFHEYDPGYFPGPEIWQTARDTPTSGITQPPVAGFAVRRMFEGAKDKELAKAHAKWLLPRIHAWHEWFFRCRDPQGSGLVSIIHPWESGRDNSIDWDIPLAGVPVENVESFSRRDIQHADPAHRPTHAQYQRYISLIQIFREHDWDTSVLHDTSPFQVVDPGFNAILCRSCADLAVVADHLGEPEMAAASRAFARQAGDALESLWDDRFGQYLCLDRRSGKPIESPSVGGLIPAFARIPKQRASQIARKIEDLGRHCEYLIPSHDPRVEEFDGLRYWRGPAWLIVNYMVAVGLRSVGESALVHRLVSDSVRLIEESGFAEYYDPITAEPCGGGHFTWTAAMVLEIFADLEAAV